jgi:hypothetical protein
MKEDNGGPVLEGHCFHTRGIEVIDLSSANAASIVFQGQHAAFDVLFMEPFKAY